MNITNKIKINFYPELKNIGIDEETLERIISNKNFKEQYKNIIKPFIKYLKEYVISNEKLNDDVINQHLKAVFELSINNNSDKYIRFIKNNHKEYLKLKDYEILNDPNFDNLYSMIKTDIFSENICEIINNGNSQKLIEFLNQNSNYKLDDIKPLMFNNNIWNVIKNNPTIGDTNILNLFNDYLNILEEIINNNLFEGLKYTYENIPEGKKFIENELKYRDTITLEQFSMDFINNIGDESLNQLYKNNIFWSKKEFDKLFEIVSLNNYELIHDIINLNTYDISFKSISKEDMKKDLLEVNIDYKKRDVFLNKYFGVKVNESKYIKRFLDSINKVKNLPEDYKNKYSDLLKLLNQVFISTDEEIINISKALNKDKIEDYKNLIKACEIDGNNILRSQFVDDLKTKNEEILNTAGHKEIKTEDGKTISVYELTGQPFTMLVHGITDNRLSMNNKFVKNIAENPSEWKKTESENIHISTSLINEKYMSIYGTTPEVIFGFKNLESEDLKIMGNMDMGINRSSTDFTEEDYDMREFCTVLDNTITSIDDLMESTIKRNVKKDIGTRMWNEVVISRVDKATGNKRKPNYIVCLDKINENSIKAAEYFNVPIYLIEKKYYPFLIYNKELDKVEEILPENLKR